MSVFPRRRHTAIPMVTALMWSNAFIASLPQARKYYRRHAIIAISNFMNLGQQVQQIRTPTYRAERKNRPRGNGGSRASAPPYGGVQSKVEKLQFNAIQ